MPRIDPASLPVVSGTGYPSPHNLAVNGRSRVSISLAGGLTQYGANLVTLLPGSWSSQRHWHSAEDELVVVLSGEVLLVEQDAETRLRPGDIATFKAGEPNGHHLQNRSDAIATFLAIGTDSPNEDECHYPDIDMHWSGKAGFTRKP